ncbi:MAG: ABC transporter substrate-binding protein [Limisphaerales bacterium]
MIFRVRLALFLAALILALGRVCAEGMQEASALVIGVLLPPEEPETNSIRQGVLLAVEETNRQPGPKVTVVFRGRTGPWGADATEAAQLVNEDGAQGLIAPPGGAASHLLLQVAGRTAVPVVTLCPDSSVSETGVPWMVRIPARTTDEARALFIGLASAKPNHARRWSAFVPDGRAGREAIRDLTAAATAAGCQLEKPVELGLSPLGLARAKEFIGQARPDAILLWLDPPRAAELARGLRAAGFNGTLAGPGRLGSKNFATLAGSAAEDFVVPVVAQANDDGCRQRFEGAFLKHYGRDADPTAAMAYDAATLLIGSLRTSGDEPAYRAFPLIASSRGATGMLSFDRRGNRLVALRLVAFRGGRWEERRGAKNRDQP